MGIHGVIISTQAISSTIHLAVSVLTSLVLATSGMDVGMSSSVMTATIVNQVVSEVPVHTIMVYGDHSIPIDRNGTQGGPGGLSQALYWHLMLNFTPF